MIWQKLAHSMAFKRNHNKIIFIFNNKAISYWFLTVIELLSLNCNSDYNQNSTAYIQYKSGLKYFRGNVLGRWWWMVRQHSWLATYNFVKPLASSESVSAGWNCRDTLLMQKRFLEGGGPSPNTWPRWALHLAHCTSVRIIPGLAINKSRLAPTLWLEDGWGVREGERNKTQISLLWYHQPRQTL